MKKIYDDISKSIKSCFQLLELNFSNVTEQLCRNARVDAEQTHLTDDEIEYREKYSIPGPWGEYDDFCDGYIRPMHETLGLLKEDLDKICNRLDFLYEDSLEDWER